MTDAPLIEPSEAFPYAVVPGTARYANAEQTALVVGTVETGDVAVTQELQPEEFAAIVAAGSVAPYSRYPGPVTQMQARGELRATGKTDAFSTWIKAQSAELQEQWLYASYFAREASVLTAGLAALGMTAEGIDGFYFAAAARPPSG